MSAAEVLAAHMALVARDGHDRCRCRASGPIDSPEDHARHLTEVLSAAGLLAEPTDQDQGKTRIEWGVRRNHGDVGSVAGPMWKREAEHFAGVVEGSLVSREVSTGPWSTSASEEAP